MSLEIYFIAVGILILFAVFDLVVGVSNDAVNFLNSSIGSKVASFHTIMLVASAGILLGVLFSGGMMEVARKGIFHPQFFTMPELIVLFMAVMLADVVLLDLFNTYGIPTSTTVSIIFELLGAAVALSLIKVLASDAPINEIADYINSAKAMTIIFGILLSVVISFIAGAVVQVIARLAFTFDYKSQLKTWGGVWGGLSIAVVTLFILIKGAKHAAFLTPEDASWIAENWILVFGSSFLLSALLFQILASFFEVNVLKPIVLLGTFSLALAFAANDLVNFIGVPVAGYHAYWAAASTSSPLEASMSALQGQVPTQTGLLLAAGFIMAGTLWFSSRARKVTDTSVALSRQEEEGDERFESAALARVIVRMASAFLDRTRNYLPRSIRKISRSRLNPHVVGHGDDEDQRASFDLLRASVNLIVASAVISFATSLKLPLSTTYVTFMVAMGTSFSDQAWGRETAVYRVTGVLTVIGCWFLTSIFAFGLAFIFAGLLYHLEEFGALLLLAVVGYSLWSNHIKHSSEEKVKEQAAVFNLSKIQSASQALRLSFEHCSILLKEIRGNLDITLRALFATELDVLRKQRRDSSQVRVWSSIITANVFKVLRLFSEEQVEASPDFSRTHRCLQNLSEAYRDITVRAYEHTRNHHKPLLTVQVSELFSLKEDVLEFLEQIELALSRKTSLEISEAKDQLDRILAHIKNLNLSQAERIRNRSSKTRLTILYLAIVGDLERLARQALQLLEIYVHTRKADEIINASSAKKVQSIFTSPKTTPVAE